MQMEGLGLGVEDEDGGEMELSRLFCSFSFVLFFLCLRELLEDISVLDYFF